MADSIRVTTRAVSSVYLSRVSQEATCALDHGRGGQHLIDRRICRIDRSVMLRKGVVNGMLSATDRTGEQISLEQYCSRSSCVFDCACPSSQMMSKSWSPTMRKNGPR